MIRSGEVMNLHDLPGKKIDKHSTGGVGDKTSLVLAPMVAAAGVPMAKLSGRGIGHTGGTLDKLESIPGFEVALDKELFFVNIRENGLAIASQTADIVPADKKLYALRDVTATVNHIALIASSIMSKKIAGGADAIVLDVKFGDGAMMPTLEEARSLAETMVEIGALMQKETVAVLSSMEQPLGMAIGNALEVKEAIETLKGKGPEDLLELCIEVGSHMLILADKTDDTEEARHMLRETITSGRALEKFIALIRAQKGDDRVIDDYRLLPAATFKKEVLSPVSGYVSHMETRALGECAMQLGAGRAKKEDPLDHAAGIVLNKKVGDKVTAGERLATIHTNDRYKMMAVHRDMQALFEIATSAVQPPDLIAVVLTNSKSYES
jgi:pyrimidine-nucleoside phosphorylase